MEREQKFNEVLDHLHVPEGLSNEEAWRKLNQRITTETPVRKIVPMWKKVLPFTAAVACLVLVFWVFSSEDTITKITDNTRETVELPDGSKVHMNKQSEISFNQKNWSENREVSLKGEAFFEVTKGSKFTVVSDHGEVSVLGTSFNIFNRSEYFEVSCFTGKVAVANEDEEVILTPGKETKIKDNDLVEAMAFEGKLPDWRLNKIIINDSPLPRILKEIESEFGVSIINESGISDETALLKEIINLKSALDDICLTLSLTYEMNGDQVILKKKDM